MNVQDQQMQNQLSLSGGMGNIAFGKEGLKLAKKEAQNILAKRRNIKPVIEAESEDWSIIPGGALHAHRNNLKVHDSELAKQVTGKGVPVVTFEEGGEIEQHAEIERGEIIFREEVSKKLEELWKDGSEEAMIEAGKMISEEIVNNTKDKSGEYEIEN